MKKHGLNNKSSDRGPLKPTRDKKKRAANGSQWLVLVSTPRNEEVLPLGVLLLQNIQERGVPFVR